MHTHWSQFVPNKYVNPASEDIKLHIIGVESPYLVSLVVSSYGSWKPVSDKPLWLRWTQKTTKEEGAEMLGRF